ncbi:MAG: hypothetical protein IT299_06955 [Dehalococcoidia bacterium]|nr:hypothetical protein [Dehalococcoidia bacterium]
MPKSIAGAYAIAGTAIAIALIVVAGSTVGLFGGRQAATGAEAAAQTVVTQSSLALDVAAAAPERAPGGATEFGTRGEREHEEREHAERGRVEGGGVFGFLRNDDD